MAWKKRTINLPAPYLRRVWLDAAQVRDRAAYPFCLPFVQDGFQLDFDRAITIIVGENGTGKSTLVEGIAALAGYDEAGGGKGYRPVDHSGALEVMGGTLVQALRPSWLPKITTGLAPVAVQDTDHYRLMREFCANPATFIDTMLED